MIIIYTEGNIRKTPFTIYSLIHKKHLNIVNTHINITTHLPYRYITTTLSLSVSLSLSHVSTHLSPLQSPSLSFSLSYPIPLYTIISFYKVLSAKSIIYGYLIQRNMYTIHGIMYTI